MMKLTEEMVVARTRISDLTNVKKLNCWGADLSDVSLLRKMPNVEVLALSVNQIRTLADFQNCTRLQELYIRKNNIHDLREICYLKGLTTLRNLWLADNPCSEVEDYRQTVLHNLPQLQKLDDIIVKPEEIQEAARYGRELTFPSKDEEDNYDSPESLHSNESIPPVTTQTLQKDPPSRKISEIQPVQRSIPPAVEETTENYEDASVNNNDSPKRRFSTLTSNSATTVQEKQPESTPASRRSSVAAPTSHTQPAYDPPQTPQLQPRCPVHNPPVAAPVTPRETQPSPEVQPTYNSLQTPVIPAVPPAVSNPPPAPVIDPYVNTGPVEGQRNYTPPYYGDQGQRHLRGFPELHSPRSYSSTGYAAQPASYNAVPPHYTTPPGTENRFSPTRPVGRTRNRASNLLMAALCLVNELDYASLEVLSMAVRNRLDELDD